MVRYRKFNGEAKIGAVYLQVPVFRTEPVRSSAVTKKEYYKNNVHSEQDVAVKVILPPTGSLLVAHADTLRLRSG